MNDIQALLLASLNSNNGTPLPAQGSIMGPNSVIGSNITSSQAQLTETFLKELIASPQGMDNAQTQALCLKLLGVNAATATAKPAVMTCLHGPAASHKSFPCVGNHSPLLASRAAPVLTPPLAGGGNQATASNQSLHGNLPALLLAGRPAIHTQLGSSDSHAQCQTLDQILSMNFKPAAAGSPASQLMSPPGSTSVVSEGSISHFSVGDRRMGGLANQENAASVTPQLDADSESTKKASTSARREKQLAANRMYTRKCRRRKKELEENMKKENEELRKLNQILGAAPDLIISFDASGAIRFINDASLEFLGMTPKHFIGTSFWDILSDASAKRLKNAFMDSLAKRRDGASHVSLGEPMRKIMLKDQSISSPLWSLRGSIYFPEDGAPECVCTIHHVDSDPKQDAAEPVMESTHSGPVKKRPRL